MRGRLLVVSHAAVLPANQPVYAELMRLGWEPTVVVPARWRHVYSPGPVGAAALPELETCLRPIPVAFAGRPQRHVYRTRPGRLLRRLRPVAAFLEEEPFSIPALQWGLSLHRAGVPFGIHTWENLDRPFPAPARAIRRVVLDRASFVAARSPAAAALVRRFGPRGEVGVARHGVVPQEAIATKNGTFTVGYAGRLVEQKGVNDLVEAAARLGGGVRLLLVGDGPLRAGVETRAPGVEIEVLDDMSHERMHEAYGRMDVLVLPSRTTPHWAEQFGRVLVEAMACGVPVIGSDSGEIPWVIRETGGGVVFPEGDIEALRSALERLREDGGERDLLARTGRAAVESRFGIRAAAEALDALLVRAIERGAHG